MENCGRIPTILIVEDIEWIRSGMRKAVEREGYSAAEARNDAEAFECADQQPIDLILTEEKVPALKDLISRLPKHPTLSSVPVAIINPDIEHGSRYGDAYVLADYADISSFLAVEHR